MRLIEILEPDFYGSPGGIYELFFENPRQVWLVFYHDTFNTIYRFKVKGSYCLITNLPEGSFGYLSRKACKFLSINCDDECMYRRFDTRKTKL